MKLFSLTLFLFSSYSLYAQDNITDWFPFLPTQNSVNSRINMKNWLDSPAGKHGFVKMKGEDIAFEDGMPIKFWGVNIAGNKPFVDHPEAIVWADFMAAYGINAVRFHKFTWDATDGIHSTQLTPEKWGNFDFFNLQLRNRGIYYAWSHIYGHRVQLADSSRLLAYSEVKNTTFPWSHLNGSTASLVNFAEDLQNLNIELTVNMLNHKNPHSGLRYADDPALAYIELQNEDNIFWGAMEATLKQTPTYKKLLNKKFSVWLKQKYSTTEALKKVWGYNNLPTGETIENENIYPNPNHSLFSSESEMAWKNKKDIPQHVVDKAMFLYGEQIKFYNKFVKAIRQTGYKGMVVGSCWQAGSGISHLLNLRADYETGVIDRHNYFGGGTGHTFQVGKVNNKAMVDNPGSGLLSTGFQQVSDRPFFISEWMDLIPNEWTAESAPIVATYGLGLQGWDASFAFALDHSHFTNTIQSRHGVYNVSSPTQLALYPALARMIYRGDINQAPIIAERSVSISALENGNSTFYEKVEQESDIKKFQSTVPMGMLAKGRVVLTFDENKNSSLKNNHLDSASTSISSITKQLTWHYKNGGYFSVNTKGTQGVVGFAKNKTIELDDFLLKTENEFAVVLVTSLDKENGISSSGKILVTTIARARNTGMEYDKAKNNIIKVGEAPILLEPVSLQITLKKKWKNIKVYVLDHSGNRTGQQVPVTNGHIELDGKKYRTIYYEVVKK